MDWYGSSFDITADYNLSRGSDLAFFFGAGAGLECVSNIDYMGVKTEYDAFHLMPRVGIEMFRHLRFTLLLNTYNFKPNDNIKRSELSAIINRVALPDSRLRVITEAEMLLKNPVQTVLRQ